MASIKDQKVESIVILRALKLGDFLLAVPALRALRAAFPGATIDYIGLPWNRELVNRFSDYLSGFIEFPGFPGLPERAVEPRQLTSFLETVQGKRYDLALQIHGSGNFINPLVELFGAGVCAGYATESTYWPNRKYFIEYPKKEHEVRKPLKLLEHLELDIKGEFLEFPLHQEDERQLNGIADYSQMKGRDYACIHPGAVTAKPWPPECFADVADRLAEQGLVVVITGSESEKALADAVIAAMKKGAAVNLAGKTSLGSLAALLSGSRLTLANDTGVGHLAVAVNTPSITVFTTTDPGIWAPLDSGKHKFVLGSKATVSNVTALTKELLTSKEQIWSTNA